MATIADGTPAAQQSAAPASTTPAKKARAPKTPKTPRAPKEKKAVKLPTHPAWAIMMTRAVEALHEKGGSSISAIKKWILANNKVEADKLTPHLRRGLKAAIKSGKLVQAKGKGLTGSFKLAAKPKAVKAVKKPKAAGAKKPRASTGAAKKPRAKKPAGAKAAASPGAKPKKSRCSKETRRSQTQKSSCS